ncbi:hypothetical protein HGRIS_013036 [Hohenbuehelia grisea]|uniref:Kinesin motor domain-containing protein n=1 Tax=Hohenbuehelia grisea TaxID=104357 RepID=A0ABR3IU80_9AGAR
MATKRPPSSRSKANPMNPPQALPRSRSALARPAPSSRSTPTPEDHKSDAKALQRSGASHIQEDVETNIQVYIRCRRRSEREIQDNSPIIVSSAGAKSKEVSIETSAPVSSLGIVTLPPVRTYPYDLVFGPEADQALIYHEVVAPMLEQVTMGYNCTLFAYGQTGTGKTYTMAGDLDPTPMGNPSPHAGMIPRVLFRLFHQLETSSSDYSVKISYIELYNEELRDLLANDFSAPVGSAQPMAMGSARDPKNPPDGGLKIFDDASKRGVFIQGLEEVCVKDSKDALALLTKGSQRRQIAATKFNDHSSRSHSVFSITVHMKETSSMGEDLLKVGKLNLVDLAGSENIGRSGAENKRAREAGMINQSLLTLNRVINALVEKSSHIPYRESKLTRLLQDSLGGRTKTCIIATISPARSNIEETLSTLDYALRAKSIRNRPEVNQRMTRNALLKEYVAEIERLKSDVLATREKNGIYFSEETWEEMSREQELVKTEREEARKQIEIIEGQMRAVREEFEQCIGLLMKRDEELKETKEKLKETEETLDIKETELKVVKGALEEEVVVREAHQTTESVLDSVATGIRTVAQQSITDVDGLFSKLERKAVVLNSNARVVINNGKTIATAANTLAAKLDDYISIASRQTAKLQSDAQQFETQELETLASYSARIDKQLEHIREVLASVQAKDATEGEALASVQGALKETNDAFKSGIKGWTDSLKRTCDEVFKGAQKASSDGFAAIEEVVNSMGSVVEATVRDGQSLADAERVSISEISGMANQVVEDECAQLRQQNAMLKQLLDSEQKRAKKATNELVSNFTAMVSSFVEERNHGLQEVVTKVTEGNLQQEQAALAFSSGVSGSLSTMEQRTHEASKIFGSRRSEGKRKRDDGLKALSHTRSTHETSMSRLHDTVFSSATTYTNQVSKQHKALHTACSEGLERVSRVKRARVEETTQLGNDLQSELRSLQQGVGSTSRNVKSAMGAFASDATTLAHAGSSYHSLAFSSLATLQHAVEDLAEEGTRQDSPTGSTPKKRVWEYVDQWELTKSRGDILSTWRRRGMSEAGSETFVAEHLPLPGDVPQEDGDEDEDVTQMPIVDPLQMSPARSEVSSVQSESPVASLASSVSSTASSVLPPPPVDRVRHKPSDVGLLKGRRVVSKPIVGTLVDSRTSNIQTRVSRRR